MAPNFAVTQATSCLTTDNVSSVVAARAVRENNLVRSLLKLGVYNEAQKAAKKLRKDCLLDTDVQNLLDSRPEPHDWRSPWAKSKPLRKCQNELAEARHDFERWNQMNENRKARTMLQQNRERLWQEAEDSLSGLRAKLKNMKMWVIFIKIAWKQKTFSMHVDGDFTIAMIKRQVDDREAVDKSLLRCFITTQLGGKKRTKRKSYGHSRPSLPHISEPQTKAKPPTVIVQFGRSPLQDDETIASLQIGPFDTIQVDLDREESTGKQHALLMSRFAGLEGADLEQRLDETFASFDMDGSGQIDSYELQRAVHSLGFFLPESEWQALIDAYDEDGDSQFDKKEFRHMVFMMLGREDLIEHESAGEEENEDQQSDRNNPPFVEFEDEGTAKSGNRYLRHRSSVWDIEERLLQVVDSNASEMGSRELLSRRNRSSSPARRRDRSTSPAGKAGKSLSPVGRKGRWALVTDENQEKEADQNIANEVRPPPAPFKRSVSTRRPIENGHGAGMSSRNLLPTKAPAANFDGLKRLTSRRILLPSSSKRDLASPRASLRPGRETARDKSPPRTPMAPLRSARAPSPRPPIFRHRIASDGAQSVQPQRVPLSDLPQAMMPLAPNRKPPSSMNLFSANSLRPVTSFPAEVRKSDTNVRISSSRVLKDGETSSFAQYL